MYSSLLRHAVLPLVSSLTRSRFWDRYQEMLALERQPLQTLERLQTERLAALLRHAVATVPLHRERTQRAGLRPEELRTREDLCKLPPTTKGEVQAGFPDRVVSEGSDRSDWQYVSTSGTANRLMVIQDFHKRDMVRASTARSLRLSGGYELGQRMVEIPPDVCNIVCGAEGEGLDGVMEHLWEMARHGRWTDPKALSTLRGRMERNWILRKRTYQPFGPQGTNPTPEHLASYVAALRRDRPRVLKALPTYLHEIARYVEREGERPLPIPVVKPMGSSITPRMRAAIERNFGGHLREEYGSAEFGDMACDCDRRDGLHVFLDLYVLEVTRGGRPVAEGELGRILVTDLSNHAMPMLRYDIGDVGRLRHQPCGCGRAAPRLVVEGRVEDTLVNGRGEVFSSDAVMDFFYGQPGIDQFQLVELKPGRMELCVVPAPGTTLDERAIAAAFADFYGEKPRMEVYPVRTIKPEVSGKFRFVQSASHHLLEQGD